MPANLDYLHDRKFAVLMVADDGTEQGDWIVLGGIAKWRNGQLSVHRGMDVPEFPVPEAALDRVKPVFPGTKDIMFGADYFVTLSVGPIPPDEDPATFEHTGVRWPDVEPKPRKSI